MQEYIVTIGGVEHTMQMTAEDAERYGDLAKPNKAADKPNKARGASNKGA